MIFALMLVGAMLFAGGRQGRADGRTNLVFWHSMGGRNGDVMARIVNNFNNSQDRIFVDAQFQGSYDDAITKMRATPRGSGPDIMQLYDIGTRWAIDSGLMLRMQYFIDRDNFDTSDYEPNILAYYTIDGQLFSMPFNTSAPVLIYNREALARAGIDSRTAFVDMEATLNTARALHRAGVEVGGSFTNYSWGIEQSISRMDMHWLDNGNGRTGRATTISPEGERALLYVLTRYHASFLDPSTRVWGRGTGESKNQFATGNVGFIFDSSSVLIDVSAATEGRFTLGFAPHPAVNPGDRGGISVGGASLWLVDNGNARRADAAWEFVQYMTSPPVQVEWSTGTGFIALRRSAQQLPAFQNFLRDNPFGHELIVALNALQNSTPRNAGAVMGVFPQARVIIENEIEAMANNPTAIRPQAVVNNIVRQINEAITMYNRTN